MATQTNPLTHQPPSMSAPMASLLPSQVPMHGTLQMTSDARQPGNGMQSVSPSGLGLVAAGGATRSGSNGAMDSGEEDETRSRAMLPVVERLPVELTVAVPVRNFRVRNLLAMTPGTVIETQWTPGEDLPLSAGEVQLAWTEFEVVDTRLAVRVTRLG
jgi:flagellar motor switch/type III secretory pathway protein FliN